MLRNYNVTLFLEKMDHMGSFMKVPRCLRQLGTAGNMATLPPPLKLDTYSDICFHWSPESSSVGKILV